MDDYKQNIKESYNNFSSRLQGPITLLKVNDNNSETRRSSQEIKTPKLISPANDLFAGVCDHVSENGQQKGEQLDKVVLQDRAIGTKCNFTLVGSII